MSEVLREMRAKAKEVSTEKYLIEENEEELLLLCNDQGKVYRFPKSSAVLAEKMLMLLREQYEVALMTAFERTWSFKERVLEAVELMNDETKTTHLRDRMNEARAILINLLEPTTNGNGREQQN